MSIIQGTSKAAGGAGYEIDQSIRFNDDDSSFLNRTFGSAGNRKTYTFSGWFKRANILGANTTLTLAVQAGGLNSDIHIQSDEKMRFRDQGNSLNLITNQVFRDPGAWFHIVASVDTTQSTASNRAKLYLNGSQITSFSTETYMAQNSEGLINSADNVEIGRNPNGSVFWDGYQAEINFIDGTALGASSFAEYNDDGVWVPKAYTNAAGYGNNGFYITGADSADLGADYSGNGNDFTSSGLATTDQMLDTPTLNHWTLNPLDSGSTLANGNLQNKGGNSTNTHAPAFPKTGKWYVEIDCIDINTGTAGAHFFGICDASVPYSANFTTHAATSAGQQRGGQLKKDNSNTSSGTAVNDGDVIALAFDADNLTLDLYVNNIASGSQITGLTDVQYKLWIQDGAAVTNMQFNFAEASFEYTPPTGYVALSTANLATPSITDGSAHFQPTLYTGTGSSQAVTQSGNSTFQPDWVWIKGRSGATEHVLTDAVRGVTKELSSNDVGAEETVAQGLTAFGSSGFTVGTDGSYNTSSATYVGWQWKANGAGSSNTDGSITSTVSANTTAGFSIVSYVSNDTGGATVGHGLGVAPSVVIQKNRDSTDNWYVLHTSLSGAGYNLYLDLTNGEDSNTVWWNGTNPTSTVVTLGPGNGAGSGPNEPTGENRIMYCFAEVPGYSSFGSYTGNGSTNGTFVYTGFKPAFVILKRTNATQEWQMYDTERDPFNVADHKLEANSSNAESILTGNNNLDFLSNGFKLRQANGGMNASGSPYIYMAFAENPFGGDGVAPATAR